MVSELQASKSETIAKEKTFDNKIVAEFEDHMNNDLDVKGAFDCLTETISELHKNRESLSKKDVKNLMDDLHRIDSVFRCIF
jgi:cysteinyl-tRNA synthetase